MSVFGVGMPAPAADIDDGPFWQAHAEGRLVFQRCADCGRHRHPPAPMCPACQSTAVAWSEAPSRGTLFSFTVTHVAPHPAVRDHTPYVVALVSFADLDDVRLVTNLVGAVPAAVRIGAPVELVWDADGEGPPLPRFRLVAAPAAEADR